MHNFQELKIWQRAMDVVEQTYIISALFPNEEKFGLTSQIRKSAVSIPSNIAEGAGRNTNGEFKNFLGIHSKWFFKRTVHAIDFITPFEFNFKGNCTASY